MADEIVNRVAKSGIVSLDLEALIPPFDIVSIDLKEQLFQEMLLKEADFRAWVKEHDWDQYHGKHVAIFCSNDAIIPTWAYMLVTTKLSTVTNTIFAGQPEEFKARLIEQFIATINPEEYRDARVVIKGCSDEAITLSAYTSITQVLQPVVKTIMFGEPCSTVPLWKR